ncbi:RNA polymerase sigma factor [Verrucomicrobiales bacterium]|mgnify:CR=1 FL=1|jgi:RNA polymerase sigma-70 factor (ECF subfamily)|nr:RNA polymerase sigma factor [Verrucomicrobiales bacterium]MDC0258661.1 RNA polymerase sigma factor [Verrucomicrobiales bacterium]MDC0276277.1 RNA polymerase sigma factor [Verrucomicrobiales bacterium]|tara:strand:+ start:373 stop:996 length:624 start_codon:yes stop_codon:yes gene_type:complete
MSLSSSNPELDSASDRSLIECYLGQGDDQAGEALIQRHAKSVYRFVFSILGNMEDSEDVCQQAFTRAFSALPAYRDEDRFRSWLFRIAKNEALGLLRKKGARPQIERELSEQDLGAPSTAEEVQSRGSVAAIASAVQELPPAEREVVFLRMREGLSFREIAELTDAPLGTVLSRMSKARERLRKSLMPILGAESIPSNPSNSSNCHE